MTFRLIAAGAIGTATALYTAWWLGLIALAFVLVWTKPTPPTKLLMTLDTETGVIAAEPADRLTEEYLRKRGS